LTRLANHYSDGKGHDKYEVIFNEKQKNIRRQQVGEKDEKGSRSRYGSEPEPGA